MCKTCVLYLLELFFFVFLLFGCCNNQKSDRKSTDGDSVIINSLSLTEKKDTMVLDLTDLFDSVCFVPLETHKDAFFGEFFKEILVNRNHILVIDSRAVLDFNPNGIFNGKLLHKGRGPSEFLCISSPFISDHSFYFRDSKYRDRICCFDFDSNRLGNIKVKKGLISDLWIINDSLINYVIGNPVDKDYFTYKFFVQNLKGDILNQLDLGNDLTKRCIYGPYKLLKENGNIFLATPSTDTIWNVTEGRLITTWTTDLGQKYDPHLGNQTYYNATLVKYSNKYILNYVQKFEKKGKICRGKRRELCYINRENAKWGKVCKIKYHNLTFPPDIIQIYSRSDGYLVFEISAPNFIELVNKYKTDFENIGQLTRFIEIGEKLNFEDNPVLIIGRYKN